MPESCPLTVLIAEDADSDRMILASIIREEGHHVVCARDGLEAVENFCRERPDMVLLDALMPGQDGFETARQIRQLAGEQLLPILFLTALSDTESLVQCLAAGGDDFLQKPYNRVIIQAKIKAFTRMRDLHNTVLLQRNQISQHNRQLLREQSMAKQVFDNIAHQGCLDASNVRYHLSPRAVFNGDVLVAALRPSGNMMILLGDFTGHGLPAAIGAMPLATIFYGMVHKGFALTDILREINDKLNAILPVGMFCCATFVEVNFRERSLTVWNGGLPDCFIYRRATAAVEAVKSIHLPLGVLPSPQLRTDCQRFELEEGDRCFLWTDGIHEARNSQGEMFGEERIREVFAAAGGDSYHSILSAMQAFTGGAGAEDDLSLVEITMVQPDSVASRALPDPKLDCSGLMEWQLDFEVRPSTFRHFDPLPLLLSIITEVPGLRSHSGSVYTVLAELYSNALEHGVLRLDSRLKETPDGFSDYYRLRDQRLQQTDDGFIRIHVDHDSGEAGGCLRVRIIDSGAGFDHCQVVADCGSPGAYSGRGIALLTEICDSLQYRGVGNEVEAIYSWRNSG